MHLIIVYALDDNGNITKTTIEDWSSMPPKTGSLWDYEYDGRCRLTKATRSNDDAPDETIQAVYEYTYDDGDNLLTRVMPFEDNFKDGNGTDWSTGGTITFTVPDAAHGTKFTSGDNASYCG